MLKQRHKALMLWARAKDYQTAQAIKLASVNVKTAQPVPDRIAKAEHLEASRRSQH